MDRLMTRKEKEKVLLDGLGLNVGDKIMLTSCSKSPYEIKEKYDVFYLYREYDDSIYTIDILLTEEFEKYVEPKKWKDMKCIDSGFTCSDCPLFHICEIEINANSIQEYFDKIQLDDEEREFYQKRIDREYKGGIKYV